MRRNLIFPAAPRHRSSRKCPVTSYRDDLSPVFVMKNTRFLLLWFLGDSASDFGFREWSVLRCCAKKYFDIVTNYCQQQTFASVSWDTFNITIGSKNRGRALLRFASLNFTGLRELNIDARHAGSWKQGRPLEDKGKQIISLEMFRSVLTGCPMLRVLKMCTGIGGLAFSLHSIG